MRTFLLMSMFMCSIAIVADAGPRRRARRYPCYPLLRNCEPPEMRYCAIELWDFEVDPENSTNVSGLFLMTECQQDPACTPGYYYWAWLDYDTTTCPDDCVDWCDTIPPFTCCNGKRVNSFATPPKTWRPLSDRGRDADVDYLAEIRERIPVSAKTVSDRFPNTPDRRTLHEWKPSDGIQNLRDAVSFQVNLPNKKAISVVGFVADIHLEDADTPRSDHGAPGVSSRWEPRDGVALGIEREGPTSGPALPEATAVKVLGPHVLQATFVSNNKTMTYTIATKTAIQ